MQASDGKLYGMTAPGGIGYGSIFSFDPLSPTFKPQKNFEVQGDGGCLLAISCRLRMKKLYGMMVNGGINKGG